MPVSMISAPPNDKKVFVDVSKLLTAIYSAITSTGDALAVSRITAKKLVELDSIEPTSKNSVKFIMETRQKLSTFLGQLSPIKGKVPMDRRQMLIAFAGLVNILLNRVAEYTKGDVAVTANFSTLAARLMNDLVRAA